MVSEATRGTRNPFPSDMQQAAQSCGEACDIREDVVNYLTRYARENPGYTALTCLGIGFVLGWKLKPW